ncbi:MAG: ATP-binding protein, partial [Nitrososphaerota archaeon]
HGATAVAIQRALQKFRDIEVQHRLLSATFHFSYEFVDDLTRNREIAIIDFSADGAPGIPTTLKQITVAYLSSLLFKRFTEYKIRKKERYLMFIIEESQNYVPNLLTYNIGYSLAKQKLSWIATQGRKFGLSLCLITQRPSFVDPVVLSMCNTFFIHRVSPEDISFVDKVSGGLPAHLKRRLTYLERGEVIVVGQMSKLPFPVLIRVPKRKVNHTAGTTDVLGALMRVSSE